ARAHRESRLAAGYGRDAFDHRGAPGHRHQFENPRVAGRREQHGDTARPSPQDGARSEARKRKRRREEEIVAIHCRALTKRFGDVVAVAGLDLTVAAGECFGLLGPNGAGKTTTIEICEGLLAADSGEVELLGLRWDKNE